MNGVPGLVTTDAYRLKQAIALTKSRRVLPNLVAVSLILSAYAGGLIAMFSQNVLAAAAGVLLVAHAMILAWYLGHDCSHGVVIGKRKADRWLGELLSWINGYSYFAFTDYINDHLRHHSKQVDIIGIEMAQYLARLPRFLYEAVLVCEYFHIPLSHSMIRIQQRIDILLQGSRPERIRVIVVLTTRCLLLSAMLWASAQAFLLYITAVILRIHCVRFVDAFQHTYPEEVPERIGKSRGHAFELTHTFSFPLAYRHPVLNLLILNFGYHNAHHAMPSCPWYHLRRLHELLYEDLPGVAPPAFTPPKARFEDLLKAYHRHRLRRMTGVSQGLAYDEEGYFSFAQFYGAYTDKLLG